MAIATVFLEILLLSFNHLSDGVISSKSSRISHVFLKGIAEDIISEKKEWQNYGNILGIEQIEPTVKVNTSGQYGVGKSHLYLADDHHDDHNNDRQDHDRDHHDNNGNDDDDDDDGWFDYGDNQYDNDNDKDYHDHDHNRH